METTLGRREWSERLVSNFDSERIFKQHWFPKVRERWFSSSWCFQTVRTTWLLSSSLTKVFQAVEVIVQNWVVCLFPFLPSRLRGAANETVHVLVRNWKVTRAAVGGEFFLATVRQTSRAALKAVGVLGNGEYREELSFLLFCLCSLLVLGQT